MNKLKNSYIILSLLFINSCSDSKNDNFNEAKESTNVESIRQPRGPEDIFLVGHKLKDPKNEGKIRIVNKIEVHFKRYRSFLKSLSESEEKMDERAEVNWTDEQSYLINSIDSIPVNITLYDYQGLESIKLQQASLDSLRLELVIYLDKLLK